MATEIARRTGALVLSADSMLVYRGMDVGTAKPSEEELAGTVFRGANLVAPDEPFSAGRWLEAARAAFDEAEAAGRDVVVAGGTGLYVTTLLRGIDVPASEPALRARLEEMAAREGGPAALVARAEALRPGSTAAVDTANPRRVIRLLEILMSESPPRSGLAAQSAPSHTPPPPPPRRPSATASAPLAGLWFDPDRLALRIEARARAMFANGALQRETQSLLALHPGFERSTAGAGIGYAEALALLRGEMDEEEAIARVATRTRHLAKKQRTWWRHQANVVWVPGPENPSDVPRAASDVLDVWRKQGRTTVAI